VPFAVMRSAYSASKAFLNTLTANLRMELRTDFPGIAVTTFMPGVVATDFGLNARHGGVDSRQLPYSQSAHEVAEVLVGVMETRKADVYSREMFRAQVADYFAQEDITLLEAKFGTGR
jgi:short-subunit dehydrogenase